MNFRKDISESKEIFQTVKVRVTRWGEQHTTILDPRFEYRRSVFLINKYDMQVPVPDTIIHKAHERAWPFRIDANYETPLLETKAYVSIYTRESFKLYLVHYLYGSEIFYIPINDKGIAILSS